MESPASATLSCVQRNSVQFSDTQRESEGDSKHSQTLKESPARFKIFERKLAVISTKRYLFYSSKHLSGDSLFLLPPPEIEIKLKCFWGLLGLHQYRQI